MARNHKAQQCFMHCVLKLKGKGIGITIKLFHKQVNSESIFTRQILLLPRSQKTQSAQCY